MVMNVVITYGTYDLFHIGHLNLLERLAGLGNQLIVGVSTDEFNELKGKRTVVDYKDRARIVAGLKCVDMVIPEENWEQKRGDIVKYGVDVFGMGHDWQGKFDELCDLCKVVYLPRTDGISSTQIKELLKVLDKSHVNDLKKALDLIQSIVQKFE